MLYAVAIAFGEVANLEVPRPDLRFSCLFPLTVPIVVYGVRWGCASRAERWVSALVVGVSGLLLAAVFLLAPRSPIDNATLRAIYEVSAILNAALLGLHAAFRGRGFLALLFGPAALYGVLLENGGILLGYFSEVDYRLYLGPLPAPLATMCGWVTVFYIVTWVAWAIGREVPVVARQPLVLAGVATMAALFLDLQIDPLATAVGFWSWHAFLPRSFMDVPLLNFAAWACAVLPFAFALFWRQHRFGLSPDGVCARRHVLWLTAMVPAVLMVAALLFAVTMVVVDNGFHGPTWAVLRQTLMRWGIVGPDVTWAPGS